MSQDTISTVDFYDSEEHTDDINPEDTSNTITSRHHDVVVSVRLHNNHVNETNGTMTKEQQARLPPPPPPPLIVQCPSVIDVLFPMEGFTLWPGNIYCKNLLQQHRSNFILSSYNKELQARILLEIVKMIQSQQQQRSSSSSNEKEDGRVSRDARCGRFLKAIQVPNRKISSHQIQNLKLTTNDDDLQSRNHKKENSNSKNDDDATIQSKTIWEVMYESDVLIQLNNIINHKKDDSSEHLKNDNNESHISSSAMAILQGLYYVPNYYPTRTEKRPHEYDSNGSCDESNDTDESVVSYSSDDNNNENEAMRRMKKRRVIHRTLDDFVPTTTTASKPSASIVSNNNDIGVRAGNPTKKPRMMMQNAVRSHQPLPTSKKVSMIGRITVKDDTAVPVAASSNATSTSSSKTTDHNNNYNIDNESNSTHHSENKGMFQYRPKSMKSHQAMIEQEGSDNLPKGVTVRPSGKWVS